MGQDYPSLTVDHSLVVISDDSEFITPINDGPSSYYNENSDVYCHYYDYDLRIDGPLLAEFRQWLIENINNKKLRIIIKESFCPYSDCFVMGKNSLILIDRDAREIEEIDRETFRHSRRVGRFNKYFKRDLRKKQWVPRILSKRQYRSNTTHY